VDIGFRGVGADLQHEIAVARFAIERVVGKLLHRDQVPWPQWSDPETIIEQRSADRDRHRQVVGIDLWT
jgi:hypothetical protein